MDCRIPQSPEEQAKLKKRVIGEVRAVLLPEKQGLPLEKLNRKLYIKIVFQVRFAYINELYN